MITAIIQARLSSTRLPGKVLLPILGKPMLAWQLDRLKLAKSVDQIVLAIPNEAAEDSLAEFAAAYGVKCFRGSQQDVLDRFYKAAKEYGATTIVRITGDCPLLDSEVVDRVIQSRSSRSNDYTSNVLDPTFPDGLDVEVFTFTALEKAWREAKKSSEREHVTPYIYNHPELFSLNNVAHSENCSHLRLTVDNEADFARVRGVFEFFAGKIRETKWTEIYSAIESGTLNWGGPMEERNEGYRKSLEQEALAKRYQRSELYLERALKVIPLGSQTFSKSITQYPRGISPFYIERGQGSKVWDIDGNSYIDFICSLCAVNLGYCDKDVDAAVRAQLEKGVIFSLPSPLEAEVAEQIVSMVPSAEKVRFGKNGSDATSGAIRLARGITKRDHVAVCGYHGWQDWYIGSTSRNLGVPAEVQGLTHKFEYGNIDSLHKLLASKKDQFACVIMEAANVVLPDRGYLAECQALARKHGALFVLDETITGFRFAEGGAQELFGLDPDLSTFGKGIANGYPLAAIAGKAEHMRFMEEIFFSFTFGGECLSLAAAKATLNKIKKENVIEVVAGQGKKIQANVARMIDRLSIHSMLKISGHPSWSFLTFSECNGYSVSQLKTFFMQEVFRSGILTLGNHNVSFSHSDADVNELDRVYNVTFEKLAQLVKDKRLELALLAKPVEPLFKVR